MVGIVRSPDHDTRRSWTVYITGSLKFRQCIGIISLRTFNEVENRWQLGYLYRPQYWGNGYATESCLAAIDCLRRELESSSAQGRANLVAYVDPGNEESIRVLEKLGFVMVGHKKLDGPDRFLAGQWRRAENLIFKRGL